MKHVAVSRPLVTRAEVESSIEILIALLDDLDGDPDLEDATDTEDDWTFSPTCEQYRSKLNRGPGCIICDPDQAADDISCDDSWEDTDEGQLRSLPLYGADQSAGPLNLNIAALRDTLSEHHMSLVQRGDRHEAARLSQRLQSLDEQEAALPVVKGRA